MISAKMKMRLAMLLALVSILLTSVGLSFAQTSRPLPNPTLVFLGPEYYQANGKSWIRSQYFVENASDYPNALFAPAPALPPCGSNTKASRTWVDIFDQSGKRLYGFCALGSNTDLNKLWFALEEGVIPPSWVYIEMNDRQTSTKYKSNLSDTTM